MPQATSIGLVVVIGFPKPQGSKIAADSQNKLVETLIKLSLVFFDKDTFDDVIDTASRRPAR